MSFQEPKRVVRSYFDALEEAEAANVTTVSANHCADDLQGYLSFPWRKVTGARELADTFWAPLKTAFTHLQRREDIFFAGSQQADNGVWVVSMGHYMGLFDQPWLNIPPSRRTTMIRYAEFHQVASGRITQSGIFIDLIGVMRQAGFDPLPGESGHHFVYPGPRTHDGILTDAQDPAETRKTTALVDAMVADLDSLNKSGNDRCPPSLLARTWHNDMVWYGPAGIGASYTIPRYQEQHQYPFREGLTNKVFSGHVARIAEGNYAGFFGWPNLKNSAAGFLGVEENGVHAEMQVVDIYRRDGDKLLENWVIIDLPYWLHQQSIDVFDCIHKGKV